MTLGNWRVILIGYPSNRNKKGHAPSSTSAATPKNYNEYNIQKIWTKPSYS